MPVEEGSHRDVAPSQRTPRLVLPSQAIDSRSGPIYTVALLARIGVSGDNWHGFLTQKSVRVIEIQTHRDNYEGVIIGLSVGDGQGQTTYRGL